MVWRGLGKLIIPGRPLGNGYYTRHPSPRVRSQPCRYGHPLTFEYTAFPQAHTCTYVYKDLVNCFLSSTYVCVHLHPTSKHVCTDVSEHLILILRVDKKPNRNGLRTPVVYPFSHKNEDGLLP